MVRGIGCITIVLVPALSYAIADYWIKNGMPGTQLIPRTWLGTPQLPGFFDKLDGLAVVANLIRTQTNLTANLFFTLAATFIIGGFMAIAYGYIYSMFGPSRYGPTDVPPPRVKTKKYNR
jgi:ABC-type antimicrobial peptide transport system permease subunit